MQRKAAYGRQVNWRISYTGLARDKGGMNEDKGTP